MTLALLAVLAITPIGSAHRTINERYNPQRDGFATFAFEKCRRINRTTVDCRLRLTNPIERCQEVPDPVIGPRGLCDHPGPDVTGLALVRARNNRVREIARWTTSHGQTEQVFP